MRETERGGKETIPTEKAQNQVRPYFGMVR